MANKPKMRAGAVLWGVLLAVAGCGASEGSAGDAPADAASNAGQTDGQAGAASDVAAAGALDAGATSGKPEVVLGGSDKDGNGFVDWSGPKPTPPMLRGPQGAQHVWVSLRARQIDPKKTEVWLGMEVIETGKPVFPGERWMKGVTFKNDTSPGALPGGVLIQGLTAVVGCPCRIHGMDVRVYAKIKDSQGVVVTDEVVIAPTWDDPADCNEMDEAACNDQGPKKL